MKRSDVYKEFEFYTGKRDTPKGPLIPSHFRPSAFLLLLAVFFDFLQYAIGSIVWEGYKNRISSENPTGEDTEVKPPDSLYWPARFFYYAKMVALALAYLMLLLDLGTEHLVFG